MKHLIAPLIATMLLALSGFSDSLERATGISKEMAALSEDAPAETAAAARGVGSLPEIATLTTQQATALEALADALDLSEQRIAQLGRTLDRQIEGMIELQADLKGLGPAVACVRERLSLLVDAAAPVPDSLGAMRVTIEDLSRAQQRSIRHMRSINRKLAALGVIATAQGVEAPEMPETSTTLPEADDLPGSPC